MIYNIQIFKDYPDGDQDPNVPKTVKMMTYDMDDVLIQQNGPGLNPSAQIIYLQNLLTRDDLTEDQIEMANEQIEVLQQFLIDNPTYDPKNNIDVNSVISTNSTNQQTVNPVIPIDDIVIPKAPVLPKTFLQTALNFLKK